MPIRISEEGPSTISVILGYGDIGVGHLKDDGYKGVGFVQLKGRFKANETIPEDQHQGSDTIKVLLLLRNKRGLAELRRALAAIEKQFGVSKRSLGDVISDAYMAEMGDKEAEIERLTYELKQATAHIAKLEGATK